MCVALSVVGVPPHPSGQALLSAFFVAVVGRKRRGRETKREEKPKRRDTQYVHTVDREKQTRD
jgi:hypothetical protein